MLKGEAQRLLGSALKDCRRLEDTLYKRDCAIAKTKEELRAWKRKARAAQLEADRNLILIEHMRKSQGFS